MFSVLRTQSMRQLTKFQAIRSYSKSNTAQLASKLVEEAKYEKENQESADWIKEFKAEGTWKIEDVAGSKEVAFSRVYENEKISAILSTDSLQDQDMDMEEQEENQEEEASSVTVSIIIEKGQGPAMEIAATAQGDAFYIDNVSLIENAKLATDQTAQADWVRRGNYGGPLFNDLDEGLVESFHDFIEARGFNKDLAQIMNDYVVYKEQVEYAAWLEKCAKFLKA